MEDKPEKLSQNSRKSPKNIKMMEQFLRYTLEIQYINNVSEEERRN